MLAYSFLLFSFFFFLFVCCCVCQISKCRSWFDRAVSANSDLGDIWVYFYRFELEHGTAEQQQSVISRCVEADPAHGEIWTTVSKADENATMKAEQILKKAAEKTNPDVFTPLEPIQTVI